MPRGYSCKLLRPISKERSLSDIEPSIKRIDGFVIKSFKRKPPLVFSEIEEFKKRKTKMGETIDIKMMDFSDNLDMVKIANKIVV